MTSWILRQCPTKCTQKKEIGNWIFGRKLTVIALWIVPIVMKATFINLYTITSSLQAISDINETRGGASNNKQCLPLIRKELLWKTSPCQPNKNTIYLTEMVWCDQEMFTILEIIHWFKNILFTWDKMSIVYLQFLLLLREDFGTLRYKIVIQLSRISQTFPEDILDSRWRHTQKQNDM